MDTLIDPCILRPAGLQTVPSVCCWRKQVGFLDRKKNEEWIEGTPESFKTWFWIRLAVSLYVGYIGVDLIIRYVSDDLAWWYLLLACAFIVAAVTFLLLDIMGYIRLRKNLKLRAEAEAMAEASSGPAEKKESESVTDQTAVLDKVDSKPGEDKRELSGIRDFARYVAKEDDADDEA